MTTHKYASIQDFITTLSKLFDKAFQSNDTSPAEPLPPEQGIGRWLKYCCQLKPVVFSYRNRPHQVHFQAFALDGAFKTAAANSLAVLIHYNDAQQNSQLGQVHLLADFASSPAPVLPSAAANQARQLPGMPPACLLLDGTVMQHRLLIEPEPASNTVHYHGRVSPQLAGCMAATDIAGMFEPIGVYLARLIVSGLGVDYRTHTMEALLRGYQGGDCIQHVLVCHVSQRVTTELAALSDPQLCTLKYRSLVGYKVLKK